MDLIKKILLESTKPIYSYKFIQTIAKWQNYGASVKGVLNNLLKLNIPNKFKICDKPIYRLLGLENINKIESHIGSWSLDINICKDFLSSDWFDSLNDVNKKKAVILKVTPKPQNIIVNLDLLWKDKEFKKSINYYEDNKQWFNEGLEFENSQKEIVYKAPALSYKNIYLIWDLKKQKWYKNE